MESGPCRKQLRLKALIVEAGVKQIEFARGVGLHPNRLSQLINGWELPNKREREIISKALGKSENEIFC